MQKVHQLKEHAGLVVVDVGRLEEERDELCVAGEIQGIHWICHFMNSLCEDLMGSSTNASIGSWKW